MKCGLFPLLIFYCLSDGVGWGGMAWHETFTHETNVVNVCKPHRLDSIWLVFSGGVWSRDGLN